MLRASRRKDCIEGNRSGLVSEQSQCLIHFRCGFGFVGAESDDAVPTQEFADFGGLNRHGFVGLARQTPVGCKIDEDRLSLSNEFFKPIL